MPAENQFFGDISTEKIAFFVHSIICISKWGFENWPIEDLGYFFSPKNNFQVFELIKEV